MLTEVLGTLRGGSCTVLSLLKLLKSDYGRQLRVRMIVKSLVCDLRTLEGILYEGEQSAPLSLLATAAARWVGSRGRDSCVSILSQDGYALNSDGDIPGSLGAIP